MKIGYTSDIHTDINKKFEVLREIANVAVDKKIEMLLIGGDISNFAMKSISEMEYLQNILQIPVHYVFGNHDYYDCGVLFHDYRKIQNTFPVIGKDFGIIGDTGWYDYSWYYKGSRPLHKIMQGKTSKGFTWPDHRFINWPADVDGDPMKWFTQYSLNEMKRQNEILDSAGITRKIVMMHMVPRYDLLMSNLAYLETNVYFGSQCFQDWLEELKPEIVLFGHTHNVYDRIINGTWYISSPVGYNFEWNTIDTFAHIDRKLIVLEV